MKEVIIALGLALLFGIGGIVVTFLFIEGWGAIGTLTVNISAFFFAGFLMGRLKPKSIFYAGLVIVLPLWYFFGVNGSYFSQIFSTLSEPSKLDSRNFYALIPMLALVSAYAGSVVGRRMMLHKKRSIEHVKI
jgi:hypothetical protein